MLALPDKPARLQIVRESSGQIPQGTLRDPPKVEGLIFTRNEILASKSKEPGEKGCILNASVELPSSCNLKCPYCYTYMATRSEKEMGPAQVRSLLDQFAELGARSIVINGRGELFLDWNNIRPTLEYILSLGVRPVVFTNNMFITQDIAKWLHDNKVSVIGKLNSFEPAIQDLMVGVKGAHKRMFAGLAHLLEAGLQDENLLAIQSVISKPNLDEIPELWVWMRANGIIPFVETFSYIGSAEENLKQLAVSNVEVKKTLETLLQIDETHYGYTWIPAPPYAASNCNRCYYTIHVTFEGEVRPCPLLPLGIGDAKKNALADVMSESRILRFVRNIDNEIKKRMKRGGCRDCNLGGRCYGCRSRAYIDSDSADIYERLIADDPLCWRNGINP